MDFAELVLVAEVDDLGVEPRVRPYADALVVETDATDGLDPALERYDGELPIVVRVVDSSDLRGETLDVDAVDAVEIPLEMASQVASILDRAESSEVTTIVSYRNAAGTPEPSELSTIIEDATEVGDVVYIETKSDTPEDALTLLSAVYEASQAGITIGGVSSGEPGRHTRIVAPSYGSKLAYAPVEVESEDVPSGHIPLKELSELIREIEHPSTEVSLHPAISNPMVTEE